MRSEPLTHTGRNVNVLALDLSLARTGYATAAGSGVLVPPKAHGSGAARLQWIRDRVIGLAASADLVILEGYSFSSKASREVLGELGGVVRLALHEAGIPFVVVQPATLKKLATGKGNAGKEEVLAAAIRRLGFEGHDNNQADAMWLRAAGLIWFDAPDAPKLPASHCAALDAVTWPKVRQGVVA